MAEGVRDSPTVIDTLPSSLRVLQTSLNSDSTEEYLSQKYSSVHSHANTPSHARGEIALGARIPSEILRHHCGVLHSWRRSINCEIPTQLFGLFCDRRKDDSAFRSTDVSLAGAGE